MIVLVAQIDSKMTSCCHIRPPIGKQFVASMLAAPAKRGIVRCDEIRSFVFWICAIPIRQLLRQSFLPIININSHHLQTLVLINYAVNRLALCITRHGSNPMLNITLALIKNYTVRMFGFTFEIFGLRTLNSIKSASTKLVPFRTIFEVSWVGIHPSNDSSKPRIDPLQTNKLRKSSMALPFSVARCFLRILTQWSRDFEKDEEAPSVEPLVEGRIHTYIRTHATKVSCGALKSKKNDCWINVTN